jgi:electron transfer flavoprotein beta subunit
LKVVEASAADGGVKLSKFELPPPKGSVKMIPSDNVAQLVDLLKNEAKVL